MEYKVDRDGCISCGYCVETCPEVFRFDSDEKAEAYFQPEEAELIARAEDCIEGCPVGVIDKE